MTESELRQNLKRHDKEFLIEMIVGAWIQSEKLIEELKEVAKELQKVST